MRPSLHLVLLLSLCSLFAQSLVSAATNTEHLLLGHGTDASTPGPKLLYVWQYDCIFDWEPVQIRDQQSSSMITWLLSLRDRLTLTRQKPLGEPLMVRLLTQNMVEPLTSWLKPSCCVCPLHPACLVMCCQPCELIPCGKPLH